ncbi:MAG TPA: lactate utilization protein [Beijerinckiaceae bacterium]|nr:lactate utilization protein [Beijerinckiaceae bacterium]
MSTARADILGNIRRSLGVDGNERIRLAQVEDRLERSPRGVIPARGQLEPEARVALFKDRAEAVQATVDHLARLEDIPVAIAAHLRNSNLPAELRIGADALLTGLDWDKTAIRVSRGPSDGRDLVAVSHAIAGVAETGTLVLTSGQDNPTTLNFLPDTHIVVVKAVDIAADYEAVWARLRHSYGKGVMPRTVNYVTGPSRSADIEQKLQLGAHGPRNLHILIVG